jgi:hypothetical protein
MAMVQIHAVERWFLGTKDCIHIVGGGMRAWALILVPGTL